MRYLVDLPELDDTIAQMAAFMQRMDERLNEVDARARALHYNWSGQAAEEHRLMHARWAQSQQEMGQALAQLRQIAATAHANYSSAATTNTAMWSAL